MVGPGKELLTSEVPTHFAAIQKGILIRERVLVELGKAKSKTEVYSKGKSAYSITIFISGRLLPRTVQKFRRSGMADRQVDQTRLRKYE